MKNQINNGYVMSVDPYTSVTTPVLYTKVKNTKYRHLHRPTKNQLLFLKWLGSELEPLCDDRFLVLRILIDGSYTTNDREQLNDIRSQYLDQYNKEHFYDKYKIF